jgi:hypothetical protein
MTSLLRVFLLLLAVGALTLRPGTAEALTPALEAAVHRARTTQTDAVSLDRLLAVARTNGFPEQTTVEMVDLLAVAAEEQIPSAPLVAKIEEGTLKRVSPERILSALVVKIDEYRAVETMVGEILKPRTGAFASEHLSTMAESLGMGMERAELRTVLEQAQRVPPAMLVQAVETHALLHQAGFSIEGARAITFAGLEGERFTAQWRVLPLIAGKAREAGRPEAEVVDVITRVLRQGGGPRDAAEGLGLTWRNVRNEP